MSHDPIIDSLLELLDILHETIIYGEFGEKDRLKRLLALKGSLQRVAPRGRP